MPLLAADVFIPYVREQTDVVQLPDGTALITRWESTGGLFNSTLSPARITYVGLYGNGARLAASQTCTTAQMLGPGSGMLVYPCPGADPDPGVAMLELDVPDGVVAHADVLRNRSHQGCQSPEETPVPQGQAGLPVFRGLFPASATATAGPIQLGSFRLPEQCASPNQKYIRRVNVTFFNGGSQAATFVLAELPFHSSPETLLTREYNVGPMDVLQVNSLPVPSDDAPDLSDPFGGSRIWIRVTADQPFLYYVSTVFDDPEPGAMPFQVYPGVIAD